MVPLLPQCAGINRFYRTVRTVIANNPSELFDAIKDRDVSKILVGNVSCTQFDSVVILVNRELQIIGTTGGLVFSKVTVTGGSELSVIGCCFDELVISEESTLQLKACEINGITIVGKSGIVDCHVGNIEISGRCHVTSSTIDGFILARSGSFLTLNKCLTIIENMMHDPGSNVLYCECDLRRGRDTATISGWILSKLPAILVGKRDLPTGRYIGCVTDFRH